MICPNTCQQLYMKKEEREYFTNRVTTIKMPLRGTFILKKGNLQPRKEARFQFWDNWPHGPPLLGICLLFVLYACRYRGCTFMKFWDKDVESRFIYTVGEVKVILTSNKPNSMIFGSLIELKLWFVLYGLQCACHSLHLHCLANELPLRSKA